MMKLIITCAFVLFLSACATATPTSAPELIIPAASGIDTAVAEYGTFVNVERRTGVTRYTSIPLYFADPVAPFYEFLVTPGQSIVEGQLLAILNTENLDEQIERHQASIASLQVNHAISEELRQLDIDIAILENAAESHIARLRMELRQLQARHRMEIEHETQRLQRIERRRQNAELRAPFDGQVTNIANLHQGQHIGMLQPIMHITDRSEVIIEAVSLPQSDWTTAGAPGAAQVGGFPLLGGIQVDAWVPAIMRRDYYVHAHVNNQVFEIEYIPVALDERDFRPVRFSLPPDRNISAGEFVTLHFYIAHIEDILLIPENAVFTVGSRAYVYVIENGERIYTEVTIAARSDAFAAITGGLEQGDIVFVRP